MRYDKSTVKNYMNQINSVEIEVRYTLDTYKALFVFMWLLKEVLNFHKYL